jgi:hypothetical protein
MQLTSEMTACEESRSGEMTRPKLDFCVLRSPLNAQCVVARPGEQGTAGWQSLYGPDSSDGCWAWINSKPRPGMRF